MPKAGQGEIDPTALARSLDDDEETEAIVPGGQSPQELADALVGEEFEPILSSPGLHPVAEGPMAETEKKETTKQQQTRRKNVLKNLIPTTDRLLLYKVDSRGHRSYIGDYGSGDLERSASIEQFIKQYVSPTYGSGEFVVEIRKPDGKTETQGAISIMDEFGQTPHQRRDNTPSIMEMFELQQKSNEAAEKKAQESTSNMMDMFKLMAAAKGDDGGGGSMMMMMMMMQNMNKPAAPTTDPMTQMMLQKLMARLDEPPIPPLPPLLPPPAPSATESMSSVAEIVKVVSETMKAAQPQTQQNDLLNVLVTKVMQPDKNAITAKDVVDMIPTVRDLLGKSSEGSTTFNDYLEGLMRLDEIRGGGQQEDHSMLAGLAEGVLNTVRDIKMQEMQMELVKSGKLQVKTGSDGKSEIVQRRRPTAAVAPIEEPEEPMQVMSPQKPRSKVPKIPIGFRKFAIRMQVAHKKGEEPVLVMALFEGLLHLRENSEEWAPYIEEFMMLAGSEEKERALRMLKIFLHTFAKVKLVPLQLIDFAMKTINKNWDTIIDQTGIARAVEEELEEEKNPEETVVEFMDGEDLPEGVELEEEEEEGEDEVSPEDIEGFDTGETEKEPIVTESPDKEAGAEPAAPSMLDEKVEGSEEEGSGSEAE